MIENTEDLDALERFVKASAQKDHEIINVNLKVGEAVAALCNAYGESAITEAAAALKGKGVEVSAEYLLNAYRVYSGLEKAGKLEKVRQYRNLKWAWLVKQCKAPEGNGEAAVMYWEGLLSRIEKSLEAVDDVAENFNAIPDAVKPEAEGMLAVLGSGHLQSQPQETPLRKPVGTVLHTGDEHFDDGALLPEIVKSGRHIIEHARTRRPDLIVSSGDMLDTRQTHDSPGLRAASEFVREQAEIAPVFILKGTTTHDGISVAHFQKLRTKHKVYVADSVGMVGLRAGEFFPLTGYEKDLDALIFALPPANKAGIIAKGGGMEDAAETVAEMLKNLFTIWGSFSRQAKADGVMTIVSGHGTVMGAKTSTGQKMVGRDLEFSLTDLSLIEADVVCLAHIHKAQCWERERVYYCGSIAKLNVGETEDKGFWMHKKSLNGVFSEFVVIPTKEIISKEFEGVPLIEDLPQIKEGSLVRICYKVAAEDIHLVDEAALKAQILALGAGEVRIEKSVIPKQMVRAAGISKLASREDKLDKWADTTGTQVTNTMRDKLALLEFPKDVLFMELNLPLPQKRRKAA